MPSRSWLRHPPATHRPTPCPTNLPRFASVALAAASLTHGLARTGLTATDCRLCGGAHTHPAATAADNEETPMPIDATYQVQCDTCFGYMDGTYETREAAEAARKELGWDTPGGGSACPEHNAPAPTVR